VELMGRYEDALANVGRMLDDDLAGGSTPPDPEPTHALSGVYTGQTDGTGNAERDFGNWRNREVGCVLSFTPDDKWDTSWWCGQFGGDYPWRDRLCITRGLCLNGQDVDDDPGDVFAKWAKAVHDAGITNPIFRLGHEANGDWYPWKIEGHEQSWARRFDDAATQIHDSSPDAAVMFCLAADQPVDNFDMPDSASVDYYAVDLYDLPGHQEDWGTHVQLAAQYDAPLCVPEWGLWAPTGGGGGDNPAFIDWMADRTADMAGGFEAYFNKNSSSNHTLSLYPEAEQRYAERFGAVVGRTHHAPAWDGTDPSNPPRRRWHR
jgi:hypothetical protein